MSTDMSTAELRRIDLGDGAYLIQAPTDQGGDYDCYIRNAEYIGSRATEDLARACIAEQQERERRHPQHHRVNTPAAGVPERLHAAIIILEPCAGQLADVQTQQLISDAIVRLRQALLNTRRQDHPGDQHMAA
jgi:hypothetical protein